LPDTVRPAITDSEKKIQPRPGPFIAEVAVALPIDGVFHYAVPENLDACLELGSRVLVPFGRRQVTGYVLKRRPVDDRENSPFTLKEIIESLDDEPIFDEKLLHLFQFAADYYHYPLGLVIAEALPAGLKTMSRRLAVITGQGCEALEKGLAGSDEAQALNCLIKENGIPLNDLTGKKQVPLKIIRRLESRGWLSFDLFIPRGRTGPKTETWLAPVNKPPTRKLGHREKELFEFISLNGPAPVSDLRALIPSLSAVAGRLGRKGLLTIEKREVYRDSEGRALYFNTEKPTLTPEQAEADQALEQAALAGGYHPFLLFGVTGSGKTEIYLSAISRTLEQGRTALILVPEISLAPAMEGRLKARFNEDIAIIHSGLPEGERYDQWLKIRRKEVRIVLGARSGVFAPLENVGLIVVDEEHDGAYKQEDKLRYQARDLAVVRARQAGAVLILGSATPSLESLYNVQTGRYRLLTLTSRVGGGRLPEVEVLDLKTAGRRSAGGLTSTLKLALQETLEQGKQALLFLNRRGLAPLPMCLSCGYVIKCQNCSVSLTLHQGGGDSEGDRLVCHYCGYTLPKPKNCPSCGSSAFRFIGLGTEKLEQEIKKRFPSARVGRLDADTARPKGALNTILRQLRDRELDILIGTQMITKGHDFPEITLVGVIEADLGLHLPDFRAGERTFQLLAQVAGRAGRGDSAGRVIIQTLNPDHYCILRAREHDSLEFFQEELAQRRQAGYPPFSRLVLVRLSGTMEEKTRDCAERAAGLGRRLLDRPLRKQVEILGPAPSPLARLKNRYYFQILVRGSEIRPLHSFLDEWMGQIKGMLKSRGVSCTVDVDPHHVM